MLPPQCRGCWKKSRVRGPRLLSHPWKLPSYSFRKLQPVPGAGPQLPHLERRGCIRSFIEKTTVYVLLVKSAKILPKELKMNCKAVGRHNFCKNLYCSKLKSGERAGRRVVDFCSAVPTAPPSRASSAFSKGSVPHPCRLSPELNGGTSQCLQC